MKISEGIMFKGSNDFGFAKFPFKTKCHSTIVYSVNIDYLFSRRNQDNKLLKQFFD